MAGTYGAAGTNPFTIAGVGGILSAEVNATTGVTQIYRGGALTSQQSLGTYNPSTKAFTPTAGNVTPAELTALKSASGTSAITTAAVQTATKAGATNAAQLMSPNVAPAAAAPGAAATGATTPAAGTTPASATTGPSAGTAGSGTESIGNRTNNYPDPILIYPVLKKNRGSDYIHFEIKEYKKSGLEAPANTAGAGKISSVALVGMEYRESKTLANIFLPIQSGIVDSMSVDWGGGELNPITAAFAQVAYSQISSAGTGDPSKYFGALKANIGSIGAKFKAASPELRQLLINHFTQEAVGAQGLLSRTIGGALNNNLELLFNGPTLRSFTFNFKLTPRDNGEAAVIKKIIRYFKKSMAPALSQSQLFLLAPNIFKIRYIYTGKGDRTDPHPYLNRIKVAALRDFSVNYAPDGNFMTYAEDGSMTQYDLSMTFGEIDPIYENDYEQGEGLDGMGW